MSDITIGELVDHRARLQRGIDSREVGQIMGLSAAPTLQDLLDYIFGTPRLPVTAAGMVLHRYAYSNFGYAVLTAVVERAGGALLDSFVRDEVLAPMGLSDVFLGSTAKSGALAGEVSYDAEGTGPTQFLPQDSVTQEPLAYGGQFILENSAGAGGLVSNAETIARLASMYAVWGLGGRAPGAKRYGGFAGTWTCAHSLPNGMDVAFMFNRDTRREFHDDFAWSLAHVLDPAGFPLAVRPIEWQVQEI